MEIVNPFILKNKARMIKFLNELSNVQECPEPEDIPRGDAARELATVHSICELYKQEIHSLSHNRVSHQINVKLECQNYSYILYFTAYST